MRKLPLASITLIISLAIPSNALGNQDNLSRDSHRSSSSMQLVQSSQGPPDFGSGLLCSLTLQSCNLQANSCQTYQCSKTIVEFCSRAARPWPGDFARKIQLASQKRQSLARRCEGQPVNGPASPPPTCPYEQRIAELGNSLSSMNRSEARARASTFRVRFIREMENLDRYNRFELKADETGSASLKFNTPEEDVISTIDNILTIMGWYRSQARSAFPGSAVSKRIEANEFRADKIEKLRSDVSTIQRALLTGRGSYDDLSFGYRALLKSRSEAMRNLELLAERSLCFGLTNEDMELARLYHETIPSDRQCNGLERNALRDRISRQMQFPFGALLQRNEYDRVKAICR